MTTPIQNYINQTPGVTLNYNSREVTINRRQTFPISPGDDTGTKIITSSADNDSFITLDAQNEVVSILGDGIDFDNDGFQDVLLFREDYTWQIADENGGIHSSGRLE